MSRKEAINTFTDGMISDLSPLNTPNTVLTDCLNGTLITYDGNEFTLQNDKGNYPLKDCKLPANYIPVGVKEYGDILYIVSYNPLNKKVEIGSYPSPETVTDSLDSPEGFSKEVQSIWDLITEIDSSLDSTHPAKRYSELVEEVNSRIQVFYGVNPNNYKLYPGDLYQLTSSVSVSTLESNFETLDFFVIDEDRKTYDISDKAVLNSVYSSEDYSHVAWGIPGWLGLRSRCAEIDDFKVNVRNILIPTYVESATSDVKELKLDIQLFTSDKLFINNSTTGKLIADVKLNINGHDKSIELNNKRNLKNGSCVYYGLYSPDSTITVSNDAEIVITITPKLIHNGKIIVYDKFEKQLTFKVNQKGSVDDFDIGSDLWRYEVGKDFQLYFNTDGLQGSVQSEEIFLYYTIRKYYNGAATTPVITDSSGNEYGRVRVSNWNIVGETDDIRIPFCQYSKSNYTYYPNRFYPEECYLIEFEFFNTDTPDANTTPLKTIRKSFIATELMNDLTSNRLDLVYFNDWMSNYNNHIKNPRVTASGTLGTISASDNLVIGEGYNIWSRDSGLKNYRTFVNGQDYEDYMKSGFTAAVSANCPITLSYGSSVQVLSGPLWDNLNSNIKLYYSIDGIQVQAAVSEDTGIATTTGTKSITKTAGFGNKYRFVQESDPDLTLWNYENKSLTSTHMYVKAEGLYEGAIQSQGDKEPDIRLISDLGTYTYQNSLRNYQGITSQNFVSKIGKGGNDVLFMKVIIPQQTTGDKDPNWNYLRFRSYTDVVYAQATWETAAPDTFYAVFKIQDGGLYKLGFVPIMPFSQTTESAATERFDSWIAGIKHIICDDDSTIVGGFYSVDKMGDYINDSIKVTLGGSLKPSSFMYLGHNMLDESSRLHLTSLYRDSSNNYITNNFTVNPNNSIKFYFKEAKLETTEEQFNVDLSSLTLQSSALDSLDDKIALRNSNIQTDISRYAVDAILNSNQYTSTSDVYIYTSDATIKNYTLLDYLNTQMMTNTPILFESQDTNNSVTSKQVLYMGVVDTTVTL